MCSHCIWVYLCLSSLSQAPQIMHNCPNKIRIRPRRRFFISKFLCALVSVPLMAKVMAVAYMISFLLLFHMHTLTVSCSAQLKPKRISVNFIPPPQWHKLDALSLCKISLNTRACKSSVIRWSWSVSLCVENQPHCRKRKSFCRSSAPMAWQWKQSMMVKALDTSFEGEFSKTSLASLSSSSSPITLLPSSSLWHWLLVLQQGQVFVLGKIEIPVEIDWWS